MRIMPILEFALIMIAAIFAMKLFIRYVESFKDESQYVTPPKGENLFCPVCMEVREVDHNRHCTSCGSLVL